MHIQKENTKTKMAPNEKCYLDTISVCTYISRFSTTSVVFFLFPSVGEKIPEGVRGSARPVSLALEKATS